MKLILPNGEVIELNVELPYEERKAIVDEVISDWSSYFTVYRNKKTQVCLEILSNYLCYEKSAEGDEVE